MGVPTVCNLSEDQEKGKLLGWEISSYKEGGVFDGKWVQKLWAL